MKNTIIGVLIVAIIALVLLTDLGGLITRAIDRFSPPSIQMHEDSIKIAKKEIFEILNREAALIKQARADSVRFAQEKRTYRNLISRYKKQMAAINFDTATSPELDSIRALIYSDSAYIVAGPDPLYSFPISQARDALEAKAREIIKDSVIEAQAARIEAVEAEKLQSEDLFKKQITEANLKFDVSESANKHLQAVNDHMARRQRKIRWVDRGLGGLIGFAAAKTIN